MKVIVKYHPMWATHKYPNLVDIYYDESKPPIASVHIDTLGDLLGGGSNSQKYYDDLRNHGGCELNIDYPTVN